MRIPLRFWGAQRARLPESIAGDICSVIKNLDGYLDEGLGLFMFGDHGVGKTSAAVVVAKEARRLCCSVLFLTAEELRLAHRSTFHADDELTLLERAYQVDVLVIDDLGKEYDGKSGWAERGFEHILRQRSSNKQTTIITTNLPDMKSVYTKYKKSTVKLFDECLIALHATGEDQRAGTGKALKKQLDDDDPDE